MPRYTIELPPEGPLHRRLQARLESRVRLALREQEKQHPKWEDAEERTLAYMPETEVDAARRNKRDGGEPKYTTIQIPYSYAMLLSAHTYWTGVFFARNPIHQYSGRHGEGEQQVQAMEALVGYQVETGGAVGPYYIWLYDAGKYGHGVLGSYWCAERLHYGSLVEIDDGSGNMQLYQTTQEIMGFIGSKCYNVSPYDFMHDPRVALKDFQKGEFCVVRCRLGWNQIVQRREDGYYNANIDKLHEHPNTQAAEPANTNVLERAVFTLELQEEEAESSKHPAGGIFFEIYVTLIPREWGVGGTNYPQKWCFTITEDLKLIVGATPLGYMHCQFPFDVLQSEIEGYGAYTRGIPEIINPIQNTIDWLVNTHFFNVRAALNNQFIVDPSKIVIRDVQKGGPGFIWRLRPEAYGADLSKMFVQVPVNDVTRANINDMQMMLGVGERTLGINDQIMGAMQGGQRKTATEVRTTTGFGVNRLKTTTEYMSATGMSPHSQKLVQNSQQFYDASAKLRIAGSLALDAGEGFIQVTPDKIAGYFDFVNVDGTMPIDRLAQANLWKEILGSLRMMPPTVAMGYQWDRIFGWVATLAGLKNISQFKIQLTPDQQLAAMAQAGNVVPMGGGGPRKPGGAQRALPPSGASPGMSSTSESGLNAMGGSGGY